MKTYNMKSMQEMEEPEEQEEDIPSSQEIDFCTLGMFIIGKEGLSPCQCFPFFFKPSPRTYLTCLAIRRCYIKMI
jgi:hypothetical protein